MAAATVCAYELNVVYFQGLGLDFSNLCLLKFPYVLGPVFSENAP